MRPPNNNSGFSSLLRKLSSKAMPTSINLHSTARRETLGFGPGFVAGLLFLLVFNHTSSWIHKLAKNKVESDQRMAKVVLIGDSMTRRGFSNDGFWVAQLADQLTNKADVLSRGFSGYNTDNWVSLLDSVLTRELFDNAALVTVFLGTNDAAFKGKDPKHVPLDRYKENLKAIIKHVVKQDVGKDKVMLIPPPPVYVNLCNNAAWCVHHSQNETRRYYDAALEAAKEEECLFVEHWDELNQQKMFVDGLHFSRNGSEALFSILWKRIKFKVEALKPLVPHFSNFEKKTG